MYHNALSSNQIFRSSLRELMKIRFDNEFHETSENSLCVFEYRVKPSGSKYPTLSIFRVKYVRLADLKAFIGT